MNFKIKHKIPGRIRVHMGQSRMSFDQADTLQYFLETQPGVTKATVYEQTQDAVIEYDGELKELMEALKSFHYEDVQLPDSVRSSSGRALNVEYKEKLIGHVAKRLFTKYMLPLPIRNVYTIWKAFRYVKEGVLCLSKGKLEVPVLDAEKRIEMYKRELVEHMEFRLDNMDLEQKAQAKDNQVRLDNSIWHAIQSGNSDLEMRLKSDRSDNMESLFGKRDVNTVDLADMRDSEFIHAFCMRALGYATLEDPVALQAMLEEADKDPVMIALAAEDRSVKVAFIQEIEESVEETRQIKYELEEAGPKDILIDLEKEQTITAVINDHEMEEER